MITGLFLFTSDLRVQDNLALFKAAQKCQRLLLLYIFDPVDEQKQQFQSARLGQHRKQFIVQSLADLSQQLENIGQQLFVVTGNKQAVLADWLEQYHVTDVFYSQTGDINIENNMSLLAKNCVNTQWHGIWQHTLFEPAQLPFELEDLPNIFTQFRRQLEDYLPQPLTPQKIVNLPPHPDNIAVNSCAELAIQQQSEFQGGAHAADIHLSAYFDSDFPQRYKLTRNALDDWSASTKLSPWLASGCVSARQVYAALKIHEKEHGSNDSTYWIFFELLWRDYFHWLAFKIADKLYCFSGLAKHKPLTTFHAERFIRWQQGNTPYPLINAIMHQLNETGFISNRARQITASCLVNELAVDWRYGAAYFQQQLIDYDAAVNWGNWQYMAGVGADPRGGRHFNLAKQQAMFDPELVYIKRWRGDKTQSALDANDIVDWPIAK